MNKTITVISAFLVAATVWAKDYKVTSPDGKIDVEITADNQLQWNITADEKEILSPSALSMTLYNGDIWGNNPKVTKVKKLSVDTTIKPIVYRKSHVKDNYNALILSFKGGYALEVRAYNDGAAYRFENTGKRKITVKDETAEFNFSDNYPALIPYINDNRGGERYCYSFESFYDKSKINDMYPDSLAVTPLLVEVGDYKVAVSDFGNENYPGMFLKRGKTDGLVSEFAPVPLEGVLGGYNMLNFVPTKRADFIAADMPAGNKFPWRAVIIAREDKELADNDMAVRLSPAMANGDFSWVKPGKVAWDWWNNLHVYGVDFKVGRNNDTYNYYIDFASENGIEYIIVDEGWSDENSILTARDGINIPELVEYGRKKDVGVILWASWKNVHNELDEAMKKYADMGVAGFKVDFFDADDQNMMRDMDRFAKVAAQHHLLLDYHGMKANGMHIKYPNILNFEGVKGLENYRWSSTENDPPCYAVTAPFIRTLVGPMDYTPGAMTNMNMSEHKADDKNPKSEGTRAHQIAMYVIYDAPLQMLADSPTRYMANRQCTDVISAIPTVFDDTKVIDGKIGEYIVMAKRYGTTWYIGAMTNRSQRDLTIPLDFLPEGNYEMQYVNDGINCDVDASDHRHGKMAVNKSTIINPHLHNAGGFAAIITQVN